jgi:hypothetical protein
VRVGQVGKKDRDVDSAMVGRVGGQAPRGLVDLAAAADLVAAPGLVPGDDHVHEALVEVALLGGGRSPGELELLVRLEVAAGAG